MTKRERAMQFLKNNMFTNYLTIVIFIILIIASFLLSYVIPNIFMFNIAIMIFFALYLYTFYLKYRFTSSMYRLLDSQNPEERIYHLYSNFKTEIKNAEKNLNKSTRLYRRTFLYNPSQEKNNIGNYTILGDKMEFKIIENLYIIYCSEEQH